MRCVPHVYNVLHVQQQLYQNTTWIQTFRENLTWTIHSLPFALHEHRISGQKIAPRCLQDVHHLKILRNYKWFQTRIVPGDSQSPRPMKHKGLASSRRGQVGGRAAVIPLGGGNRWVKRIVGGPGEVKAGPWAAPVPLGDVFRGPRGPTKTKKCFGGVPGPLPGAPLKISFLLIPRGPRGGSPRPHLWAARGRGSARAEVHFRAEHSGIRTYYPRGGQGDVPGWAEGPVGSLGAQSCPESDRAEASEVEASEEGAQSPGIQLGCLELIDLSYSSFVT